MNFLVLKYNILRRYSMLKVKGKEGKRFIHRFNISDNNIKI